MYVASDDRALTGTTERRSSVCPLLLLPGVLAFPNSAHFFVYPSAPFHVYTYICSDIRVKNISSDKPFVWMTQADGGWSGM
jgi:hypothetical protein